LPWQEKLALAGALRQAAAVSLNEHFLWASMFWSAIASGYWIYGWRQKSWIPLAGGAAMMAASFFLPALTMSLASIVIIVIVYWLIKKGY
jgi:hypothetical protein